MKLNKNSLFNNDIDLRQEMDELLKDYGYDIVMVKVGNISCSCTAGQNQQANSLCPICIGTGNKISIEKVNVIGRAATQVTLRPNTTNYGQIGDVYSNAKTFYMKFTEAPAIGSYIFEVSWRNNKPVTIIDAYVVSYSEPYRMDNGRQEYWMVSTHKDPNNIPLKTQILRKLYK